MKSIKFIQEISKQINIKMVSSTNKQRGFGLLSENGLSITSKDDSVLISYQPDNEEGFSKMAIVSDELKTLVINAYTNLRIEIEAKHDARRLNQIKLFGVDNG
ncbi:hypothetical protein [Shewanella sp. M-Br]|uniref:hypothetical protein n=1 Tax=Shewanella sp. M-Br TaxID=2495595 RepID=UPI00294A6E0D|nr:hypothetical protein SMBr_13910 [Shewanella sp. M-Br]